MKVTVERLPLSSVALDIVADEDEFKRAVDKAYRKISQQVRIPGFRPGKAPRPIVEQRVGRDYIVAEANADLMDDLYRQAVEQEDITPVSEPSVDILQQEPLGFRVEVQVYPQVELNDYTSIRVEPRQVQVSDEDVDQEIEDARRKHSMWVPPAEPRQPRDGDQVVIDLQAFEGEEPFQAPVENATFELGEDALFPEIEESVKQLRPGEIAEFDITFAEDNEKINPEMRGKTLHYKVTLQEVKERELPEVDDEFAKMVGDYQNVDEMREGMRQNLLRLRAMAARDEVLNTAIERMTEGATVEIPPAMVDRQVQLDIERMTQELAREGMSFEEFLRFGDKSLEAYTEELKPSAEERLRRSVVLDAFAKTEGVEVSEEDLVEEIDRLVGPAENADEMRDIYRNPYITRMITDELANRKLTDRLIELVTEGVGAVTGEGAEALRAMREPKPATSTTVEPISAEEVEAAEATEAAAAVAEGEGQGPRKAEEVAPVETEAEIGPALVDEERASGEPPVEDRPESQSQQAGDTGLASGEPEQ